MRSLDRENAVDADWPDIDRRNPSLPDRRVFLRGGRRETDPPNPVVCVRCQSPDVRSLGRSFAGLWCECRRCSNVWTLDPASWRRPQ